MGEGHRVRRSQNVHISAHPDHSALFRDFGNIFGELLPGNTSKLEPPEGKDIMDGLEIKVRLGAVWKQSLTELSGGQRYVALVSRL